MKKVAFDRKVTKRKLESEEMNFFQNNNTNVDFLIELTSILKPLSKAQSSKMDNSVDPHLCIFFFLTIVFIAVLYVYTKATSFKAAVVDFIIQIANIF